MFCFPVSIGVDVNVITWIDELSRIRRAVPQQSSARALAAEQQFLFLAALGRPREEYMLLRR
jgi:hypothetical protein